MNEAIFISDLHLTPNDDGITEKFYRFLKWAPSRTKRLYILGDFFHAWPGDDILDDWSEQILKALADLAMQDIKIFFIHGNRDFLLGQQAASLANFEILNDPCVVTLGNEKVLLSHGDRYCTQDKGHIFLMKLTRNPFFIQCFLKIPLALRKKIVFGFRKFSQNKKTTNMKKMDVVSTSYLREMEHYQVKTLIHGHTHRPGSEKHKTKTRFVLSDWDYSIQFLCYNEAKGFYFIRW